MVDRKKPGIDQDLVKLGAGRRPSADSSMGSRPGQMHSETLTAGPAGYTPFKGRPAMDTIYAGHPGSRRPVMDTIYAGHPGYRRPVMDTIYAGHPGHRRPAMDTIYAGHPGFRRAAMETVYSGGAGYRRPGMNTIHPGHPGSRRAVMNTVYGGRAGSRVPNANTVFSPGYGVSQIQTRQVTDPFTRQPVTVSYNTVTGLYLDKSLNRWLPAPPWISAQFRR